MVLFPWMPTPAAQRSRRWLLALLSALVAFGLIALACGAGTSRSCAADIVRVAAVQAANPDLPTTCTTDEECTARIEGSPCGCPEIQHALTVALAAKFDESVAAGSHDCTGCPVAGCDGDYPFPFLAGGCVAGHCALVDAGCTLQHPAGCVFDAGPFVSDAADAGDSA
jgi:hypothetical protein